MEGWKVIFPKPKKRATGQVISICGGDPPKWSIQKWEAATKDMPHGGVTFASGTKWGNLLAPLSKQKKSAIISESKHTRPGPTYWKHTGTSSTPNEPAE